MLHMRVSPVSDIDIYLLLGHHNILKESCQVVGLCLIVSPPPLPLLQLYLHLPLDDIGSALFVILYDFNNLFLINNSDIGQLECFPIVLVASHEQLVEITRDGF